MGNITLADACVDKAFAWEYRFFIILPGFFVIYIAPVSHILLHISGWEVTHEDNVRTQGKRVLAVHGP